MQRSNSLGRAKRKNVLTKPFSSRHHSFSQSNYPVTIFRLAVPGSHKA
ncbi:a25eb154-2023-445b-b68e-dcef461b3c55 [Sclerotinia trifoliorum]|uniref:A25eb154-2023-445b-b68e-dcef461b3c55 n=1 Tax=Sclerotinia trifoliorum TaxID=28548 RepID=A0A8H2VUS5_9HELO|nr:a25eb154-2023-445b-b68e-dcef461b3c55 [Sclerotinia trifoliorum]